MTAKGKVGIPENLELSGNELLEYEGLFYGIRDREDTVTWRTFIIGIKKVLGSINPEFEALSGKKLNDAIKVVETLTKDTYSEALKPEILCALGFKEDAGPERDIDALLFNAHHYPEPFLWSLADSLKKREDKVGVVNTVGHFNDRQTRIIGPSTIVGKIKRHIIVSSTQQMYGGDIDTLANTIYLLDNPIFTGALEKVDVVIPFFGGSRGHRPGQIEEVGHEASETEFNPTVLTEAVSKALARAKRINHAIKIPEVTFYSVDIHNEDLPRNVFQEEGFEFISTNPAKDLANAGYEELKRRKILGLPLLVVSCDKGAVPRTELLAWELLMHKENHLAEIMLVYMDKVRKTAGIVDSVNLARVSKWKRNGKGKIIKVDVLENPSFEEGNIIIYSDDMIDTGGTARKDIPFLNKIFNNTKLTIFAATHPVLSKGLGVLDEIGADVYLLGNTLNPKGLEDHSRVRVVDVSPSIVRNIYGLLD